MNNADILSQFRRIREFLARAGINPARLLLPAFLALGAAVFEAAGVSLLIPLADGILNADFATTKHLPHLRNLLSALGFEAGGAGKPFFFSLLLLIFASAGLKNLLQYLSILNVAYEVRRFANSMRKLLFKRYLSFGKLYFDKTNSGYLQGVLVNFTNTIAFRLIDFQQLFTWFFLLATYLGMMFFLSWKLSLLVLLIFPILNYSLRWIIERIKKTSESYAEAQGQLSRRVFNTLSCMLLVKSYTRESRELELFERDSDLVGRLEYSIDKKQNIMNPIQETLVMGLLLLLISLSALVAVKKGKEGLSVLLVYFFLVKRASSAFGVLNGLKTQLAVISGPISDVLDVFEDRGKHFVPDGSKVFPGLRSGIEFNEVRYGYSEGVPVLDRATLSIPKGKMTALVGPSGAGKTTIINLLMRFYDCPPGAITVDGIDIREWTLESLRSKIALVSQDAVIFDESIRANITYGIEEPIGEDRLIDVTRRARLHDFIKRLPRAFDTPIGDRGVQLSGGEKQRLSIARAMLKNAEILILDEATSSLDSSTEKLIQEAIQEMIVGKTAVVIAHRLSTIKKADRILVLERGRVAEAGGLDELLNAKGRFHQYWTEQQFF